VEKSDMVVLLDEHGKEYGSVEFSEYLQKQMNTGIRTLSFVVGGAFGFSPAVYVAAQHKISLSRMTFNHQMVRLFFVEQLYRAFTILRHEKYHNE
jgi:23S rRNA (pseudouridine1915-N3)-methyltransferase